jgi:hypothetical protein
MNGPALQIDNPGNPDPQSEEFVGRRILIGQEACGLNDLLNYFFAPPAYFREHANALKLYAALFHGGNAQVGASQINPYGECRHTRPSCAKADPGGNYNESFQ